MTDGKGGVDRASFVTDEVMAHIVAVPEGYRAEALGIPITEWLRQAKGTVNHILRHGFDAGA